MQLRPYQSEMIAKARAAMRHHRAILLQLPTGGGKTVISTFMMEQAALRGLRSWFVVHRRELVEQTGRTMDKLNLDFGYCATGFPPRYDRPITVCSVQTLAKRMERMPEPGIIFWDEAHHCAAGTWQKIADRYPNAYHVGLSATPKRLDGKGLDVTFQALVPGPSPSWLIENGFLASYRAWSCDTPDLSGVGMRGNDYDSKELASVMSERAIVGDAVRHYVKICPGKTAVAFCCNIDHSMRTRDAFREAGVVSEHLDGKTDIATRKRTIQAFRDGKIQVLTSVDLFGEGFDLPELTAAILLRPTKSLALHLQQCGRALRTAPGKECAYILDHAGNLPLHGMPDEDREWSLHVPKKKYKKGSSPTKQCGSCFGYTHAGATSCPYCGQEFAVAPREINEVEGELVEIDVVAARKQRVSEEAACQTFEELQALGRQRGYKPGWAKFRWEARLKKRA